MHDQAEQKKITDLRQLFIVQIVNTGILFSGQRQILKPVKCDRYILVTTPHRVKGKTKSLAVI